MSTLLKEEFLLKEYEPLSWREVDDAPVSAISGVSEQDAVGLKNAFGIDTIQELAENKYVCIAQAIVTLAFLEELVS